MDLAPRPRCRLPRGLALPCTLTFALGLAACAPVDPGTDPCSEDAFRVRMDPSGGGTSEAERWLAMPWPSDMRRLDDGRLDLRDFPNPTGVDLVEHYLEIASDLTGFATNGPIHLAFTGSLDPSSLPEDAGAYLEPGAPLALVDIDPDSPERGRRFPLRWRYDDDAGVFLPAHALSVAPAWGFPLQPRTTYALLLFAGAAGPRAADGRPLAVAPAFAGAVGVPLACSSAATDATSAEALRRATAPLAAYLKEAEIDPATLAAATVFTTQATTDDLAAIYEDIHARPAPPLLDAWQPIGQDGATFVTRTFEWQPGRTVRFDVYEGRYEAPNYQEGSVPYASSGGDLHRDADGRPTPYRTEEMRFVLTVPQDPPLDGGPCYPIVEYAHGTGGDATGFSYRTAGRLAARGLAGIGIDQPLHGPRAEGKTFDVGMMTFNFLNPPAARSGFRQSAADTFSLTRLVREVLEVPASVARTGARICFDPQRVLFFGHSQGGLSGSIAAAFERDIPVWVLSGAGGGLSITLMERKDVTDIAALLAELLSLDPAEETLSELHPFIGVMQLLTEVTDPINLSRYWIHRQDGAPAPSFLVTSGSLDEATPWRTATALAVAAGLPVMRPIEVPSQSFELAGLAPVESPLSGNLPGGATGAFLQWQGEDHFVIFDRPEAIHASMELLRTAAYGPTPTIVRDPATTDR